MVTIRKNGMKKIVTSAAFKNFYRNNGWTVDNNGSAVKPVKKNEVVEDEETSEEDEWDEAIKEEFEKPLEDMTRKELEKKAKDLGIDLTGLGKTAQIREAIRVYLG